jgi:hypothetical protein
MYQVVCKKHEFITVTLTSTGGPKKRFCQCRKCGLVKDDEIKRLAAIINREVNFFYAGKIKLKQFYL